MVSAAMSSSLNNLENINPLMAPAAMSMEKGDRGGGDRHCLSCGGVCHGRGGWLANVLCCPAVVPFNYVAHFVAPCCWVCTRRACHFACGPPLRALGWFSFTDPDFVGASALGAQKGKSAAEVERETDWVRATDVVLAAAGNGADASNKRPQLFAGEIEPEDLCQVRRRVKFVFGSERARKTTSKCI